MAQALPDRQARHAAPSKKLLTDTADTRSPLNAPMPPPQLETGFSLYGKAGNTRFQNWE